MFFLKLFFQLFLILFALNCGGRTEIEGIDNLYRGTGTGQNSDTTKYYYIDGSQWEPMINGIVFENYKSDPKKRWFEIEFVDGVQQSGATFFDLNGEVQNPIDRRELTIKLDGNFYKKNEKNIFSGNVFSDFENGKNEFSGIIIEGKKKYVWSYNTQVGDGKYVLNYLSTGYQPSTITFTDSNKVNYIGMLTDNLKYLDSPNQKMETGKRIVIGQYRVKDLSETFDKYENEWSWGGTYDFRSYPLAYSEIDNVDGNGSIVLWYPNGRIKEKINYIELQKDGEFISYYRNGKIESKGNYEQNIKVGQWEYHFENNDNNYIVNYTQGQMEELTYYDAINSEFTDGPKNYTGVPVYKWNTEVPPSRRKDVSFDNLYIIQNNKNKSFSFNNYPDRIFNKGTQVSFSVSGKITMLIDKVNGDDNSFKSTNYYDNGTIKSEIGFIYEDEKFVNVIWHGRQVTFSENGQQLTDFYFKDGRWDKKQTAWYENGQKWYEYYNKDGIRVGTSIYWHENGQKDIEGEYRDGKRQGAWTQWKPNGQKQTEGEYLDGKPEGVWKEYDADGKVSEIDYNSGIFALQKEFEKSQKLKSNKMESSNNNNCDGNYFWSNNELELSIRIRGEKYSSTMIMYSGFGRIYDEENAERGSGWVKDCELYLNDGPMSNVSIGRVKVNDLIWDGLGITLDKQ